MSTSYVGEIRMFAGNFAPNGWAMCSGQGLPISEYEALFSLLGTSFGGDGVNSFNLPDLRGRVPIHMGTNAGTVFEIGQTSGVEQVTLTVQQLPVHNHAFMASSSPGTANTGSANLTAEPPQLKIYEESSANVNLNAAAINTVGGSQPHENMQPYLVITFIISLYGIFPTQS